MWNPKWCVVLSTHLLTNCTAQATLTWVNANFATVIIRETRLSQSLECGGINRNDYAYAYAYIIGKTMDCDAAAKIVGYRRFLACPRLPGIVRTQTT